MVVVYKILNLLDFSLKVVFLGPRVLYKTHLPINRTQGKCGQKGVVYSLEFTV